MVQAGKHFRLYGDPAYYVSEYIEAPFRGGPNGMTTVEKDFNEAIAGERIAVE